MKNWDKLNFEVTVLHKAYLNSDVFSTDTIGNYIVDFICFSKKIVIELDGGQHDLKKIKQKDKKRDRWLKNQGFKVLRFWNSEIFENLDGVLEMIWETCDLE